MRKITLAIALGTLALAGCGGTDPGTESDAGSLNFPKTCTANADCLSSEVCHPIGQVCVKNCKTDATVCGDDMCVETTWNGVTESVCKCETCGVTGEVCSKDLDDVCESACTSNADCAAFSPQTRICGTDGVCKFGAALPCGGCPSGKVCDTLIDTCIDACTSTSCTGSSASKCGTTGLCEACGVDADCANVPGGTYKCDKTGATPKCVSTGVGCNPNNLAPGAADGQDTCAYAEVCSTLAVCTAGALPDDTCAPGYTWNEALKGPVIVSVTGESFTGTGTACNGATDVDCCANGNGGFRVDIEFYAPNGILGGNWTAKSQQIKFIKPDGTVIDAGHFADFPSAGAKYSITPLHAGGCGSTTAGIPVTGWSVYLTDADGAGGNAACL